MKNKFEEFSCRIVGIAHVRITQFRHAGSNRPQKQGTQCSPQYGPKLSQSFEKVTKNITSHHQILRIGTKLPPLKGLVNIAHSSKWAARRGQSTSVTVDPFGWVPFPDYSCYKVGPSTDASLIECSLLRVVQYVNNTWEMQRNVRRLS